MNPLLSALTAAGIIPADVAGMVDRQMSPVDAQLYAERIMFDAWRNGLMAQQIRYIDLVNAAEGKPPEQQLAMFWQDENEALYRSVEAALVEVASDRAVQISIATGNADMWAVVNEEVNDWIGEYYQSFDPTFVGSVPNLNVTARTVVGQALTDWQRGELETAGFADGLPQLIRALEPAFGAQRAETIAVTETTRVFNEATITAGRANPLITRYRLFTAADDRVCPICGPLHGQLSSADKDNPTWNHPSLGALPIPPLHVNCRCQAVPETDVTVQFESGLDRPYTWSPETPAEYAKRRRDEIAATRPPKPKTPAAPKTPEPPALVVGNQAFLPFSESRWQTIDSDKLNDAGISWMRKLTDDEVSAVYNWSKQWRPFQIEVESGNLSEQTKNFLTAIQTAPKIEGIIYRGINPGGFGRSVQDVLDEYRRGVGTEIEWNVPSSASIVPDVAANFGNTVFEMRTKTARYINPGSYYYGREDDEYEAIIMPRTKFRIVGVGKAPIEFLDGARDRWLIQLEEIDSGQ